MTESTICASTNIMMPEDKDELYRRLQEHISEGLFFFIGSGLSCGEGLPSMLGLAKKLVTELACPNKTKTFDREAQDQCRHYVAKLNVPNPNLEAVLNESRPQPMVRGLIETTIVDLIGAVEKEVIAKVLTGEKILALTELLRQLPEQCRATHIVTTNYDRLIELAAREADLGVDTLFCGSFYGTLDPKRSRATQFTDEKISGKGPKSDQYRRVQRHVRVMKPHGSLDWFRRGDKVISYLGSAEGLERLIVAPGDEKYKKGYDTAYETHRNKANQAIKNAKKLIIIGYGFGDDHLERCLLEQIKKPGVSIVVLCKSLTKNALRLLGSGKNLIVLQETEDQQGTHVLMDGKEFRLENESLWNTQEFTTKVLKS